MKISKKNKKLMKKKEIKFREEQVKKEIEKNTDKRKRI